MTDIKVEEFICEVCPACGGSSSSPCSNCGAIWEYKKELIFTIGRKKYRISGERIK